MRRKKKGNEGKYIVQTDRHLYVCDSIEAVKKETGLMLEESEMKRIDGHYIVLMNDSDIEFVQDKRRLSGIPWNSMLKKDMTLNYLMYAMIALQVISLIKG